MKLKPNKKVRIANGPFVTVAYRTDLLKRMSKNKTSFGEEMENDWKDAKRWRKRQSQSPGSI